MFNKLCIVPCEHILMYTNSAKTHAYIQGETYRN